MRTQATDSGAAVSRPTRTAHLRPAGRLRTPVRPGTFHHDPTVRFLHRGLHLLHRGLHLQAEPLPPGAAPRRRARPARRAARRLDKRRARLLTLWTERASFSLVRDDRPVCRWAVVLRTPLQERQARELANSPAGSPAGGKWGSCSIVNAATPRSVASDPRGRGFPAPYQNVLKGKENNMRFTRAAKVAAFPLTALILVALVACQGPAGPAGAAGGKGDPGSMGDPGLMGNPGGPGPAGADALVARTARA